MKSGEKRVREGRKQTKQTKTNDREADHAKWPLNGTI